MNPSPQGEASNSQALWNDERGLSALETTGIGIAFAVLIIGFLYTVLVAGLLAAEQTGEAVLHGLQQTPVVLLLRGPVVGESNAEQTALDRIKFQVTVVSAGSDGVYLTGDHTIITYIDADQYVRLTPDDWTASWMTGFGSLLNPGERVEISIDLSGLEPVLGTSKQFTVELSPDEGTPLVLGRRTPAKLSELVHLE